jgi:hypothetical protein
MAPTPAHNWAFALSACALTLEAYGLLRLLFP